MFGRRRSAPTVPAALARTPQAKGPWRDAMGLLATRSIQIIAVALLLVAIVFGLRQLTVVVIPVILALVFAAAFEPLMRWLRARMPSVLATIIVLLGIVVVIGGVGWAIVRAVVAQWPDLYQSATDGVNQIVAWINELPLAQQWLGDDPASAAFEVPLDDIWATVQGFLSSSGVGATIGSGAVAGVGAVASFLTGLVLMVVILFFFLKDGPIIWNFVLRPFHDEWDGRMKRVGTKTVDTLGAYVRGTAGVAAADAIGIGIGLFILGIPLALPLTLLVFILAFIPIVGATLAGILAALVALVDGGFMDNGLLAAVIVVGIVVLVNQLEGNFLQPVLMGRALKLHSLVILVALTIGTVTAGILGAILAVPLTAVAWGIVQVWEGDSLPAKWARKKEAPAA
ncbi:AI-2E family transporter [Microbacterium faecale]|uniref:AI-2E family transporter n=1 Tax=Microbacterium faecale TaxID=1804630 RepID=A0A917DB52_9MICO|nr:AI-2E family transporter [Microbacterium faecale]GGD25064.1 AI-2E family transporter [Microbacterium faecale]